MTKIALISDLHYGARGDSLVFLDYTKRFMDNVFFPTLKAEGIYSVIVAGDLVDRRKYINYNTAKRLSEDFIGRLEHHPNSGNFVLPGNHDIYHKDNNEVNALDVLCTRHDMFVVNEPFTWGLKQGPSILMVPWICPENQERVLKAIEESTADICIGHFELQGFTMYPGMICSHGMSASVLSKFKMVFSGHFHTPSRQGNIQYLGSPLQITWNDYDDPRGFWILDTETMKAEFIQNPYELFVKLVYDDKDKTMEETLAWDFPKYEGAYVKVVVRRKTNPYWFDLFIEKLEAVAADVKVIDEIMDRPDEDEVASKTGYEDTITILRKYVEQTKEISVPKERLQDLMVGLYNEAIQMGA